MWISVCLSVCISLCVFAVCVCLCKCPLPHVWAKRSALVCGQASVRECVVVWSLEANKCKCSLRVMDLPSEPECMF